MRRVAQDFALLMNMPVRNIIQVRRNLPLVDDHIVAFRDVMTCIDLCAAHMNMADQHAAYVLFNDGIQYPVPRLFKFAMQQFIALCQALIGCVILTEVAGRCGIGQ